MRGLIAVEWRRYLSRRLARLGTLGAVAIIFFAGVMTFIQAGRDAEGYRPESRVFAEQEIERCIREDFGPEAEQIPEAELRRLCQESVTVDPRFRYTDTKEVLIGAGSAFIMLAYLFGASFMGAEWHFGTITTTLTWEPRRARVFLIKALAAALGGAILYVILEALLAGVLYPAAAVHGITEGLDGEWMRSVGGDVLRGAGVASLGAAVGLAVAAIGRNTAAALGGGFLYFAVLEPLLRAVRPKWAPWLVGDNATVFLTTESTGFPSIERSVEEAGLILLAYAGAMVLLSVALFHRRDVT